METVPADLQKISDESVNAHENRFRKGGSQCGHYILVLILGERQASV